MTDEILTLEKHRSRLTAFMARPGCHTCDRAEAGHQLAEVTRRRDGLQDMINFIDRYGQ